MTDFSAAIAEVGEAIRESRARIDKRIDNLENSLDNLFSTVDRASVGGSSGCGPQAAQSIDVANFFSAARRRDVSTDEVSADDLVPYDEAFKQYLRIGENTMRADVRSEMSVGSDPDGGYWVTPTIAVAMKKRLFETSAMRRLTDPLVITGSDSYKIPLDINDAVSGGFVGETESRPETDTPEVGEQEIFLREQFASPKVTQKLLDMSTFDVALWLTNKIADKLVRIENNRFVTGTGVKAPRGFLDYKAAAVTTDDTSRSWGVLQYVPTGQSGGFPTLSGIPGAADAGSLIDLQYKLKPDYREEAV